MGEKEINITFETLFELLRREKGREELQNLENTFYKDVEEYLAEKKRFITESKSKDESFDAEKYEKQLENIKKIIRDLLERRERKIMELALTRSKTGSASGPKDHLIPEEKIFFNELFEVLGRNRDTIKDLVKETLLENKTSKKEVSETKPEEEDTKLIRFTSSVPKFLGLHREVYGPFEEGDLANLSKEIVDVLVKKGRAEIIEAD